jgi:hypothetical protein
MLYENSAHGRFLSKLSDVPSYHPLVYLLEFGLLTQFGRPSVDDRPNCGINEF